MRLAIFGGTGGTGQRLVDQALRAGHEVTMLARTPSKVALQSDRLRVVRGDALDPRSVAETIAGAGAIISLLGPAKAAPPLSVSRCTRNILQAAESAGARRLIVVVGAGVGDPHDKPGMVDKAIGALLKIASKDAYADIQATAAAVRASDLDWTLVRIPRLTDEAARGQPKAGYLGKGAGLKLSRDGLARFLLAQLEDKVYIRKAPVISD